MEGFNPPNNVLAETLKDLDRRLSALEKARQPYRGDWIDFNPGQVVVDSANKRIQFIDFDPTGIISVGGRIRIIQSPAVNPNYSYFSVIDVDALGYVYLFAGLDFTLTAGAVVEISYSSSATSVGFPGRFVSTPAQADMLVAGSSTPGITSILSNEEYTTIVDNLVVVYGQLNAILFTGTITDLFLPVGAQNLNVADRAIDQINAIRTIDALIVSGTDFPAHAYLEKNVAGAPSADTYYCRIYKTDGGTFAGTCNIGYHYIYRLKS